MTIRRSVDKAGKEGPPKGGRNREVPLSAQTVLMLKRHKHLKGPYVFCDASGDPLTHNMLTPVVPQICRKAGLAKRITFHGLRHTFASHLVMRGVQLKSVQELLGHTTIHMTMRYAHLSPNVNRESVNLLDRPPTSGDILETEATNKKTSAVS
jgi:site-specific recombinase XerD